MRLARWRRDLVGVDGAHRLTLRWRRPSGRGLQHSSAAFVVRQSCYDSVRNPRRTDELRGAMGLPDQRSGSEARESRIERSLNDRLPAMSRVEGGRDKQSGCVRTSVWMCCARLVVVLVWPSARMRLLVHALRSLGGFIVIISRRVFVVGAGACVAVLSVSPSSAASDVVPAARSRRRLRSRSAPVVVGAASS